MKDHLTIIKHPLIEHKLTIMSRKDTPSSNFLQLLWETSMFLAYRVTEDLPLVDVNIETPICRTRAPILEGKKLALISILRAGNGLLDGMLEVIPAARVGFVGMYRNEKTLEPTEYYCKVPAELGQRLVIAVDPMLATGNSSVAAIDRLKKEGAQDIRLLCLLAAAEGVARMKEAHPDVPIFTASLDEKLNEQGYIVPGLGDAGDRMFGTQ